MNPIILETMNDIINQVDAREWGRVNDHRDRLLKKMKNQSQKIENMQDDWYVATHKIAEENSELHKEIKRLKQENMNIKKEKLFFQSTFHNTLENQADDSEHYEKEIKELKEKLQLFERLRDQDTYSIKRLEKLNREVKCSRCAPWRGN